MKTSKILFTAVVMAASSAFAQVQLEKKSDWQPKTPQSLPVVAVKFVPNEGNRVSIKVVLPKNNNEKTTAEPPTVKQLSLELAKKDLRRERPDDEGRLYPGTCLIVMERDGDILSVTCWSFISGNGFRMRSVPLRSKRALAVGDTIKIIDRFLEQHQKFLDQIKEAKMV